MLETDKSQFAEMVEQLEKFYNNSLEPLGDVSVEEAEYIDKLETEPDLPDFTGSKELGVISIDSDSKNAIWYLLTWLKDNQKKQSEKSKRKRRYFTDEELKKANREKVQRFRDKQK